METHKGVEDGADNMLCYNSLYYIINAGHNVDVSNPYTKGLERSYAFDDVGDRRKSGTNGGHLFYLLPFICDAGKMKCGECFLVHTLNLQFFSLYI